MANEMTKAVAATKSSGDGVPYIEPRQQVPGKYWQASGYCYSECMVMLPPGLDHGDLHEHPQVWKKMQATGKTQYALSQFDRVTCVAHDRSWMLEARVIYADQERVVLNMAKAPRIELPVPAAEAAKAPVTEKKVDQTLVRA